MLARTLGLEGGVNCEISHRLKRGTESLFIMIWKSLPSRHVLKILRESLKGKAQRRQCLLALDLGCYRIIRKYVSDVLVCLVEYT